MSAPSTPDGVLKPTLSVFDVVAITVSAVTPASSVFVIAPFAIQQAGSGVFLAFVMAALLALMFAFCYAELGRAHNSAGGEYVYAKRVFGGMAGYATFLTVLVMLLFIPPVLATGAATYLNNALGTQFDSQTVALVIVVCSYALGILNIKLNAWITGTCLLLEVAALLVIVFIGFGNPVQPVSVLLQPQIVENGVLHGALGAGHRRGGHRPVLVQWLRSRRLAGRRHEVRRQGRAQGGVVVPGPGGGHRAGADHRLADRCAIPQRDDQQSRPDRLPADQPR